MPNYTIPAFSICPLMSSAQPPEAQRIETIDPPKPGQLLAPCVGLGCGFWTVTKMVDGKPLEGMCAARFLAMAGDAIVSDLRQLVKLRTMEAMAQGNGGSPLRSA